MLSSEDVPQWVRTALTAFVSIGLAKVYAVWAENRRLTKRDYRETLEERISDLERQVAGLFERIGALRAEVAHLETELTHEREKVDRLDQDNDRLRERLLEVDPDRDPDLEG